MEAKRTQSGQPNESREQALHYMAALVETVRESFLILDSDLRIISGSPTFYQVFHVSPKQTEGKFLYELGNGQWNIPLLRSLLEEILPKQKFVEHYEVTHTFETIGKKTILLNARQIDSIQLIVLAMEDITERKELETRLAEHTKQLEATVVERTRQLTDRVKELESLNKTMVGRELKMVELKKEVANLKQRVSDGADPSESRKK